MVKKYFKTILITIKNLLKNYFLAYHVECIDKWLLRNNRFCPVCKRRVIPGGSDSDSEENNQNSTVSIQRINQPNDDEEANESSHLLINERNNIIDDNLSSATISTTLNNPILNNILNNTNSSNNNNTDNNQFNDLSSLNNQMVISYTTSLNNQNKDLPSASSRYGSISSIINMTSSDFIQKIGYIKVLNLLFT